MRRCSVFTFVFVMLLLLCMPHNEVMGQTSGRIQGSLKVHPENPRYFTNDTGRIVYLTGSHTWQNLQDYGLDDPPAAFDYPEFLRLLTQWHHNFFRLWAWESTTEAAWDTDTWHCGPLPFLRTGPGAAQDGKPSFDVTRFNPEYFQRLHDRVSLAKQQGFYVGVMLFQGFSVAKKSTRAKGNPWNTHPFNKSNNINGIDGDGNGDGQGYEVHTLANPAITAIQEAYVRKVIDTVGEFDNVIFEISNESHGGSTDWQYHMIAVIRKYERQHDLRHPVWMSFQWDDNDAGTQKNLLDSEADAISPRHNEAKDYMVNPPVADGKKVVLLDTDHLWGIGGDEVWVWKAFTRGMNPIFMDPWKKGVPRGTPGVVPRWEGARKAMGLTRTWAERITLAAMTPTDDGAVCSTTYCLMNPGREYLIFAPDTGGVQVQLPAGAYQWEWCDPVSGETAGSGIQEAAAGPVVFESPVQPPVVLYLKRQTEY